MTTAQDPETPGGATVTRFLVAGIGAALHVLVGVIVFVSSLVAPVWAVAALGTAWLGAALWAWRLWRRWPLAPLVAAIGTGLLWVVVLSLNQRLGLAFRPIRSVSQGFGTLMSAPVECTGSRARSVGGQGPSAETPPWTRGLRLSVGDALLGWTP
ncbi:MAG TPA: hypothetical protein VGC11_01695 [Acidimicrobiia bacterium]